MRRRMMKRTLQVVEAPTLDDALLQVEYQSGYLLATEEPAHGQFNIKREMMQIEKGEAFWCHGHCGAIPVEKQSPTKPDYCVDCVKEMKG